ncbi:outer membrane beta-barrel protein [Marinobacter apostichopi]|uniref:outer membrane beta-barrel protein n=1 Tax=Marinobacter apostichopi TaxID=3035454 RepID=UPI00257240D9|nr:outer membrane beta-barrel protein [Marinobacter sp. LA51]
MAKRRLPERMQLVVLISCGLMSLVPGFLNAAPAVVSLGFDSRYTDNVRRARVGEESDLESRLSLGIQHTSDPGTCNSDLLTRVAYSHWLDESYDPETTVDLDFQGDCRISNNLVWQGSNYLRDVVQDNRVSGTPDNRTQKNVFSTGPVLTLRMGAVDELVLSAAYEDTEFREPEQKDGERITGSIGWNHFFSPTFTAGLNATADQSELDTEEEIDRVTVGLPFTKSWAATVLSGSIGYGVIETSLINRPTQEYETFVANLLGVREVNHTTELEIEASRALTDQTSSFDSRFDNFVFDLEQTSAVEVTALRLGISNDFGGAAALDVSFFGNRSDYLDTNVQENVLGVEVAYRRPITGQLSGTLGTRYEYQTYSQDDSDDELYQFNAGIEFRLNRQLDLVSRVGYEQRTSEIVSREFEETWILVGLQYQFR